MRKRTPLLTDLLRDVSRAFYLTLRVLPGGVREPIGLAYLLARAADTLADTPTLPPEVRLRHLLAFRAQVRGPVVSEVVEALRREAEGATDGERALLAAMPEALALLDELPEADRAEVRRVVDTLTQGMEMDLRTFPGALRTAGELDRYTYLVAGCVGEFWTRETMAHTPALRNWDAGRMVDLGVRFGKALQMTNILRDVPRDLANGRAYVPGFEGRREDLVPWVLLGLEHFRAAQEYTLAIPWYCLRLRLAVAWPILIGLETLARLVRSPHWLDPERRVKVERRWIFRMMALSVPACLCTPLLRAWFRRLQDGVLARATR